jgi:peptide-methionine (R)-S-oxide reductase
MSEKKRKSKEEWRRELDADVYHITREGGTEAPFSGEYDSYVGDGVFRCVCCGEVLFRGENKFQSGAGWPSFWKPAHDYSVKTDEDEDSLRFRVEVLCRSCGAHLGHVFEDGPQPTGLRYCINSLSIVLDERGKNPKEDR